MALNVCNYLTEDEFIQIILSGNDLEMSKLPGIGKKTAQRIISELQDKVKKLNKDIKYTSKKTGVLNSVEKEVSLALTGLGYSSAEGKLRAQIAITQEPEASLEKLIKLALSVSLDD